MPVRTATLRLCNVLPRLEEKGSFHNLRYVAGDHYQMPRQVRLEIQLTLFYVQPEGPYFINLIWNIGLLL